MPLGAGTLIGRPTSRTGARTGISRLLQCCSHHTMHLKKVMTTHLMCVCISHTN